MNAQSSAAGKPGPQRAAIPPAGATVPSPGQALGIPVPLIARAGECLLAAHQRGQPRAASMRTLRAELLLRRDDVGRGEALVLLSPGVGEGRSRLAADLAIDLSRSGCATLLVDADFRDPQQHRLLNTPLAPGLAQALASGRLPVLRRVAELPNLMLLTAGEALEEPLELLARANLAMLVEAWRDTHRYVVIDTPAAARFPDGLVVANAVGRVLVLSHAHHTRRQELDGMVRRLRDTGSHIVGAVISHF